MSWATYGQIATCCFCGQDIQFMGETKRAPELGIMRGGWVDRGRERKCSRYQKRNGDWVMHPKTNHRPHRV